MIQVSFFQLPVLMFAPPDIHKQKEKKNKKPLNTTDFLFFFFQGEQIIVSLAGSDLDDPIFPVMACLFVRFTALAGLNAATSYNYGLDARYGLWSARQSTKEADAIPWRVHFLVGAGGEVQIKAIYMYIVLFLM